VFNFSRNFGRLSWSYPDLSKAADSKKPLEIHSDGLICMAKKNTLWYSWMLKIKKLFLLLFLLFFLSFFLLYHTSSQKSANLIGETDSMAKFTLWTPWTATSQNPWIRSYTPSLATISTYHQSTLSFTYHTPYTTNITLQNQHNNILHTPYTYNNIYIQQQPSTHNYRVM